MTDSIIIKTLPTLIPFDATSNPDSFYTGELLSGGQFLPHRKLLGEPYFSKAKILLGPTDSIILFCERQADGRYALNRYQLNLQKLLYGHNGRILDQQQIKQALSALLNILTDFFKCRNTAADLVPGLTDNEQSWFHSLEIAAHINDPDNKVFTASKNAKYPRIRKRLISDDESVRFGSKKSGRSISVYKKCEEMKEHYRGEVEGEGVLRVEVTLKSDTLIEEMASLGSVTTKFGKIEGKSVLTSFSWDDLRKVHRQVICRMKGLSTTYAEADKKPDRVGAFIANIDQLYPMDDAPSIHKMVDLYVSLFKVSKVTANRIRNAAVETRQYLDTEGFSLEQLFCEESYNKQPDVIVKKKEKMLRSRRYDTTIDPLVAAAYGDDGGEDKPGHFTPRVKY